MHYYEDTGVVSFQRKKWSAATCICQQYSPIGAFPTHLCLTTNLANVSNCFEEKCLSRACRQDRDSAVESSFKNCSSSCTALSCLLDRLLSLLSALSLLVEMEVVVVVELVVDVLSLTEDATLSGDDEGSVRTEGDPFCTGVALRFFGLKNEVIMIL